jgi:hypothetical protein
MINPISPKRYTSVDPKQTKREAGSKRAQHSQGKEDKWKRKKILRPKAAAADKEETKRRQRGDKGEKGRDKQETMRIPLFEGNGRQVGQTQILRPNTAAARDTSRRQVRDKGK